MENIIVTDSDTIQKIVSDAIDNIIDKKFPTLLSNANRKKWMTKDDLIEYTGWSSRTIQHLRDTKQIPYIQHGRKILYPTDGIDAFLNAHRIPTRK